MVDSNKDLRQPPKIVDSFLTSVGHVGMKVPNNTEAYQTALAILTPALILLSAPDVQRVLKTESFHIKISAGWETSLAGDALFNKAINVEERLINRIDYAEVLLRQMPEMMNLQDSGEDVLFRQIFITHANSLKLCINRHEEGTGNLDLTDPVSAAREEISRLQAILAGKLGLIDMSVVGMSHDGQSYANGISYFANPYDPETRNPT